VFSEVTAMEILAIVPIILIAAFILGEMFKRIGLPSVIGQILAGLMFGIPVLKELFFSEGSTLVVIDFLATLGILLLLFLAGLEIEIEKIKETSRDSILISICSALVPFALGFIFIMAVFPEQGVMAGIIFGGALMVTSEGTNVKVLMDFNVLNTRLGAIMLAAGAIDDIFEVLFLALVVVLAKGGSLLDLAMVPVEMIIFLVVAFIAFKIISKVLQNLDKKTNEETGLFSIVLIFILVLAALSESLNVGYLIGAILGGFLLQASMKKISSKNRTQLLNVIKLIAMGFVVPFFFVNVGLTFDIDTFLANIPMIAITVVIASVGKLVGTLIVKPVSSLNWKQLYYVGWAMNSRGAAELVIALIAVQYSLISPEIFSALVSMSLITTLILPPILARGIKKNPGLMDAKVDRKN
jgi:Kef-type K+ transport system membrane component KefB